MDLYVLLLAVFVSRDLFRLARSTESRMRKASGCVRIVCAQLMIALLLTIGVATRRGLESNRDAAKGT